MTRSQNISDIEKTPWPEGNSVVQFIPNECTSLIELTNALKRQVLVIVLNRFGGNRSKTAAYFKTSRKQIWRAMKQLDLKPTWDPARFKYVFTQV